MARDEQKIESLISESQIQTDALEQKIAESKFKVFNKIIEKNSTKTASKGLNLIPVFLKPAFMFSIAIVVVASLILINRVSIGNTNKFNDLDSSIQAIDSEINNLDSYLRDLDSELAELDGLI